MTKRSQASPFTADAARLFASLVLCASATGWAGAAWAQAQNTSTTLSYTSQTSFESPPLCNPLGSSRSVQTVTLEDNTVGPVTIIIGNRDNIIPTPPGGCVDTQLLLPSDTVSGRCFRVLSGTTNLNVNTHTQTFQCVAAVAAVVPVPVPVPLLPWPALLLLGNLLAGLGAWQLARRRKTE